MKVKATSWCVLWMVMMATGNGWSQDQPSKSDHSVTAESVTAESDGQKPRADGEQDKDRQSIDCAAAPACKLKGLCAEHDGDCVAVLPEHCTNSVACSEDGRCTLASQACIAVGTDCEDAAVCEDGGRCLAENGRCIPGGVAPIPVEPPSQLHAPSAQREHDNMPWPHPRCTGDDCREHGDCSDIGGECAAGSRDDCQQSLDCREDGRCFYDATAHSCEDTMMRKSKAAVVLGIVGIGVGTAAVLVGSIGLTFLSDVCHADTSCNEDDTTPVYGAITVLGGLVAVGGIVAVTVGAPKVRRQAVVSPLPRVTVALSGISLDWRF
ncbi:MAG: hypothetical protein DRI90_21465 [Deltaproteobacteria bacterium]|nr:MAG: hypothetical protein DRI90_21465 [Deltaproteobacteria bacterium]